MQKTSIDTLYHIWDSETHALENGNVERHVPLTIEDRVQRHICFEYRRPGETICTCGSMLQGIPEEIKKQVGERMNSRFIMCVPEIHNLAVQNTQRGRRYGNSAESQTLKKARGRAVPNAHARTRIHAIRHGII